MQALNRVVKLVVKLFVSLSGTGLHAGQTTRRNAQHSRVCPLYA